MPVAVTISAAQLERYLRKKMQQKSKVARAVALEIMVEAEARAVRATDDEELVDLGEFKRGWSHGKLPNGAEVGNDAPHAAVLEHGRRPGRPGPPFEPIFEWVKRKLFDAYNPAEDEVEAEALAWVIRNKLHRDGMQGRHILRGLEPWIIREYKQRIRTRMNED